MQLLLFWEFCSHNIVPAEDKRQLSHFDCHFLKVLINYCCNLCVVEAQTVIVSGLLEENQVMK